MSAIHWFELGVGVFGCLALPSPSGRSPRSYAACMTGRGISSRIHMRPLAQRDPMRYSARLTTMRCRLKEGETAVFHGIFLPCGVGARGCGRHALLCRVAVAWAIYVHGRVPSSYHLLMQPQIGRDGPENEPGTTVRQNISSETAVAAPRQSTPYCPLVEFTKAGPCSGLI